MSFSWKENLPEELKEKVTKVEKMIQPRIEEIDEQVLYNQQRVLDLFRKHHVGEEDLVPSTGYGYDDIGRDKIEDIYADYFKTDDALVRPQFGSGTHAITVGLFSMLRPGDTLYYLTGTPYDTIQEVIGLAGNKPGNMKEWGINFKTTELTDDGQVDYEKARKDLQDKSIKVVAIQRSLGYATRKTFTMDKIKKMLKFIKEVRPDVNIFIDNCYGEFLDVKEPTDVGADVLAGSLIKNPGGGLALTGGYVCGRSDLVEKISYRMTCPGIGGECGLTFGQTRTILQGLFLAPRTVNGAVKGAMLCGSVYKSLGFDICPDTGDARSDIIQAVRLGSAEAVVAFCEGIQAAAPVDSFVTPVPWAMPGYESDVVMAAGAFVQGSSIELSADAPIREPYNVYFQGGLTYEHSKFGVIKSLDALYKKGLIKL